MAHFGAMQTTITKPTLAQAQHLFLLNVARLINYAHSLGLTLSAGEMYRTAEQQALYKKRGLTRAAHSRHQDRLAFDLMIFQNGIYQRQAGAYAPLGLYWQGLHPLNRWGGDWNGNQQTDEAFVDANHFEMRL